MSCMTYKVLLQWNAQIQTDICIQTRDVSKVWLIFLHLSPAGVLFFFFLMTGKLLQNYQSFRNISEYQMAFRTQTPYIFCGRYTLLVTKWMLLWKSQKGWTNQAPCIEGEVLKHFTVTLCCEKFAWFWKYNLWLWRTWSFTEELTDQGSFPLSCRTL